MVLALLLSFTQPKFELSVSSIMKSAALIGHPPRGLRWSADGQMIRFNWAKADGSEDAPYKEYTVQADGTHLMQGVPKGFVLPTPDFQISTPPRKHEVFVTDNDLYIRDLSTNAETRLTHSPEPKNDPRLVLDDQAVVYLRDGNLYKVTLIDGKTTQLTNLKPEAFPVEVKSSEAALAEEEGQLFKDFPQGSVMVGQGNQGQGQGRGQGFGRGRGPQLAIAPSGGHASMMVFQTAPTAPRAAVPAYVTRSGYTEFISTYPKVGMPQSRSKLEVVDLKTGAVTEIACPRPGRVGNLQWSPDGKHAIAVAEAIDHKDTWIFGFDPSNDHVQTLWDEHDDAWVGGPGRGLVGWLPDSSEVYFESEVTGFAQLMTVSPDGSTKPLTEGKFEVSEVRLDVPRSRFIFVSSEGSPFKRHIDAMSFGGGPRTKLADFSADEDASFALSPDGTKVAVVRSTSNRPPELFVNGVQVTTTPTPEWLAGPWIVPPVVMVPARDGVAVPARLYKPAHWRRGGPAVVFVHGAGYLQNIFDGWSHYFREYMFHHVLMDRGYAVIDVDYRGSAGYGKAWRTAIYRRMGGKDLDDSVDAARYLIKTLGADPQRIGIYGGSYGGFLTLMGMFTASDTFAAGAALRPVSDWANYNDGYTSEILNLPQDDPDAYHFSSPIFHAEGLKGALLICHGMADTNVHFQDTVRLIERLIELGKTNWSVAPYPIEDHAFRRVDSWTDEYSRILALFDDRIGPGYKRR